MAEARDGVSGDDHFDLLADPDPVAYQLIRIQLTPLVSQYRFDSGDVGSRVRIEFIAFYPGREFYHGVILDRLPFSDLPA